MFIGFLSVLSLRWSEDAASTDARQGPKARAARRLLPAVAESACRVYL
jgi:hypothetical protein